MIVIITIEIKQLKYFACDKLSSALYSILTGTKY